MNYAFYLGDEIAAPNVDEIEARLNIVVHKWFR